MDCRHIQLQVGSCTSATATRLLTCARGASGSKGRTSWSGKPELDDYTSFAAFFIHYVSHLNPLFATDPIFTPDQSPGLLHPQGLDDCPHQPSGQRPLVILGGYSYGSLILQHLPPVPEILQSLAAPVSGSAADEILLRARKLADQSNSEWISLARDEAHARRGTNGHGHIPSTIIGGEETSPENRKRSRDMHRSVDGDGNSKIKTRLRGLSQTLIHRGRKDDTRVTSHDINGVVNTIADVRYLLISPLTAPMSRLAVPALGSKLWGKATQDAEETIGKHASLVIYGDQDMFSSAKKIRDWSERLRAQPGSHFLSVEVAGAGHFWVESRSEEKLRTALQTWEASVRQETYL